MIRVELKAPPSLHRQLGIIVGLTVALATFGGALYALDRQVPLGSLWSAALGWVSRPSSVEVSTESPALPPPPEGTQPQGSTAELPARTDAARRVLALVDHLPVGVRVTTLTADVEGGFVIEGILAEGVSLATVVDLLKVYASDARGTSWSSAAAEGGSRACRLVGNVIAVLDSPMAPISATQLAELTTLTNERAVTHGLRGVQMEEVIAEPAAGGVDLHNFDLRATGSMASLRRFVLAIEELGAGIRIAHLAASRSSSGDADNQVTLSFDAVVREPLQGGNR